MIHVALISMTMIQNYKLLSWYRVLDNMLKHIYAEKVIIVSRFVRAKGYANAATLLGKDIGKMQMDKFRTIISNKLFKEWIVKQKSLLESILIKDNVHVELLIHVKWDVQNVKVYANYKKAMRMSINRDIEINNIWYLLQKLTRIN